MALTHEQEVRAQRVAKARDELRQAMQKAPFDLSTAGVTRIHAWKRRVEEARRLLARPVSRDYSRYEDARRRILATAVSSMSELAQDAYEVQKR